MKTNQKLYEKLPLHLLMETSLEQKTDSDIRLRDWTILMVELATLKSFWGKACMIAFLQSSPNKSYKSTGKKILRELKHNQLAVFKRHIEPQYNEINRSIFRTTYGLDRYVVEKVKEKLIENGEQEFIILCRFLHNLEFDISKILSGVSLSKQSLSKIQKKY